MADMNIADALRALAAIEGTIAVDKPARVKAKAYPFFGPKQVVKPPAFLNFWQFTSSVGAPGNLIGNYTVLIQLFAGPADMDSDEYAELACNLHNAFVLEMSRHSQLTDPAASVSSLRGIQGSYQPVELTWNGGRFIGCEYLLDLKFTGIDVPAGR